MAHKTPAHAFYSLAIMNMFQVYRSVEPTPFGYIVPDEFLDTHGLELYCRRCDPSAHSRLCVSRDEDWGAAGGYLQSACHDVTCYISSLSQNDSTTVSGDLGPLSRANGAQLSRLLYPYVDPQGLGNIPTSELGTLPPVSFHETAPSIYSLRRCLPYLCGYPALGRADVQGHALHVGTYWEHVPKQSTIFNTAPTTALEVETTSSPQGLNWGSDTRFQPNTNYTVPENEPSEDELMARLLDNNSWFILHYKDACAQKKQQEQQQQQQQRQRQRQQEEQPCRPRSSTRDRSAESHNQRVQKRHAAHIRSEQQRRHVVNKGFEDLRLLVPGLRGQNFSKSLTLKTVCDRIEELSSGNKALKAQLAELEGMPYLSVPWDGNGSLI